MVYLMKDEKKTACLFKVGYTKNIDQRMIPYITHNVWAELVDAVITYKKTKMQLETAIHAELAEMGVEMLAGMDGTITEWFAVDYDSELYKELNKKGLSVFKACKGRKSVRLGV